MKKAPAVTVQKVSLLQVFFYLSFGKEMWYYREQRGDETV
jgi:hypothetical protein